MSIGEIPATLVLLGATGDLSARYLLPALTRMHGAGQLPEDFAVLGVSRDRLDDAGFHAEAAAALRARAADVPGPQRDAMVARMRYTAADVTSPDALRAVLDSATPPVLVYLALPTRCSYR